MSSPLTEWHQVANNSHAKDLHEKRFAVPGIPSEIKPDVDAIVETIIYLYTESRRLTKAMAARYGLTGPQLTVVKMLESLGDMSLSELSERIHAQNSTVTGIIDRMQREGLVVRSRSSKDRRVIHIRLTAKGRELATAIPLQPAEILRDALDALSAEESAALLEVLRKLAKHVRKLVVTPPSRGEARASGLDVSSEPNSEGK